MLLLTRFLGMLLWGGMLVMIAASTCSVTPCVRAAATDVSHCMDWSTAAIAAPTQPQPTQDTAYANISFDEVGIFQQIFPKDEPASWRMLIRPGSPFAVFYTEAGYADTSGAATSATNKHRLIDPAPITVTRPPAGNFEEDGETGPDFCERV